MTHDLEISEVLNERVPYLLFLLIGDFAHGG